MHVILDQNLVRATDVQRQGEEDSYVNIYFTWCITYTWERDLKISTRRVAGCNSFFARVIVTSSQLRLCGGTKLQKQICIRFNIRIYQYSFIIYAWWCV